MFPEAPAATRKLSASSSEGDSRNTTTSYGPRVSYEVIFKPFFWNSLQVCSRYFRESALLRLASGVRWQRMMYVCVTGAAELWHIAVALSNRESPVLPAAR
jgi:hypothetical protein